MTRMTLQAAVTMGQLQNRLDMIGNNIANINTTGYKSREANFSSLLSQQIELESQGVRNTPEGLRIGSGAKLGSVNLNLSQGFFQNTDRALDVALLNDNHLFQVAVEENGIQETRYTRSGNFYITPMDDNQVMLVNADGHPVLDADGEAILLQDNMDDLTIEENGEIHVTRDGIQSVEGQLGIMEAVRPRLLEATGDNNFRLSEETLETYPVEEVLGNAGAEAQMRSGALETSNVDLAKQTTDMLETQRAYQFNARSISMHDQMKGLINQLR